MADTTQQTGANGANGASGSSNSPRPSGLSKDRKEQASEPQKNVGASSKTAKEQASEPQKKPAALGKDAKEQAYEPPKKELTGAEKKAAAKAEKAARRSAQKGEGVTGTDSQAAGPSTVGTSGGQDQTKQEKPRQPSAIPKPPQQQLPTRARRPSSTVASTAPAKPKAQRTKQLPFLSHLYSSRRRPTAAQLQHPPTHRDIHPSVQTLALHLESYKICGSQARTIALLLALKAVIRHYVTPPNNSLPRHLSNQGLSAQLNHVKTHGRPFCTAQSNSVRWLKNLIATLDPGMPETTAISTILTSIDEYIREKFTIADQVIAQTVAGVSNPPSAETSSAQTGSEGLLEDGDHVLVFGKSAVVCSSLRQAAVQGKRFAVTCVDGGRPLWEGRTMSQSLATLRFRETEVDGNTPQGSGAPYQAKDQDQRKRRGGITSLTYIPITQLHAQLQQVPVTKALFGANSIFSNGSILSRAGQAQTALAVRTECPGADVYVLAESVKCSERAVLGINSLAVAELAPDSELVPRSSDNRTGQSSISQSDEGQYLEKGKDTDENTSIAQDLVDWQDQENLFLMNSLHDITPPDLIHATVTEIGTVPPGTAAAVGRMVGVGGELGEV